MRYKGTLFDLLHNLLHRETTAEKVHRLNFLRQKEVQKWEASSPNSLYLFWAHSHDYTQWLPLDSQSRFPSHRPPRWLAWRIAMQKESKTEQNEPVFLHRRFITYKIDYNDFEGIIVFKGIKPSSITGIDTQLQRLRGKYKSEHNG